MGDLANGSATDTFLEQWHRGVYGKDTAVLEPLLDEDVTLRAPPYWEALEGKELVTFLLGVILDTIEEFEYRREWRDGPDLALEFTGSVDGKRLQGIDLIRLGADGRLISIDVLMRPINTMVQLRDKVLPHMQKYLEGLAAKG